MSPSLNIQEVSLESLDGNGELLQSGFWGAHKERFRQTPHAFRFSLSIKTVTLQGSVLVLERPFLRRKSLAYVPHGPVIGEYRGTGRKQAESILLNHLPLLSLGLEERLPRRVVFIRYDLPWSRDTGNPERPLVKAPVDIQPPSTVLIDLDMPEEGILAQMKAKTRYNIRLSRKKGVSVVAGGKGDIDRWYTVYRETAERDRISIHSCEYYRSLFDLAETYPGKKPEILLLLAVSDDRILAGNIVSLFGNQATYLFGASTSEDRNLMPAYALQWEGMTRGKSTGCTSYDLFGIPPDDSPEHPMHGLYRFKTGFGGTILHRPGCWDFPVKPGAYRSVRMGERVRAYYYKKLKKGRV